MEKEFIPYEHSLEMKSIEFDEPCFGWYHDNTLEFDVKANETIELHKLLGRFKNCCLAPTFPQSFRWFREKYGLTHSIRTFFNEEFYYEIYVSFNHEITSDTRNTYEEAELACLIALIEIVKKNKI